MFGSAVRVWSAKISEAGRMMFGQRLGTSLKRWHWKEANKYLFCFSVTHKSLEISMFFWFANIKTWYRKGHIDGVLEKNH